MKRHFLCIVFCSVIAIVQGQQTGKLVILHTNDIHSKLRGFAPETEYTPLTVGDDSTVGGFARIASLISSEKAAAGENILVLDAGDFLMGTLFHHFEAEDGFQLRLMKMMGYDAVSIGNHEFDDGPETLARIIEAGAGGGEIPRMVLSNAVFNGKETGDDKLEALFGNGLVRTELIIDKPTLGLKIGIFALMGIDAADVAPAAVPVTFTSQIKAARRMVKRLKAEGCNMIICLSHSGLAVGSDGSFEGEDFRLAGKVKGIDLIISGHSHTRLDKPLVVKGIPIVQTGSYGENIGRITFIVDQGKVSLESFVLLPVDDSVQGDSGTEELIARRMEMIEDKLLARLGLSYNQVVAEAPFRLVCDEYGDLEGSNLGPLVADAIHSYVNRHSSQGTDISIVAAGVIRQAIEEGEQSVPDIFRVMSLGAGRDGVPGYPLSRVYVTGRELKNIAEILLVAWKSSPSNFIYYSGLEIWQNPDKGMLRKVHAIEIVGRDGTRERVDFSKDNQKLYSISANSYILEFVGIIKSMSFGLINVVPKNSDGTPIDDFGNAVINFAAEGENYREGKEWLALMEFLSAMPDTDGNGIPEITGYYRVPSPRVMSITKGMSK